jgi:protein tyrosine/serine phosphatase
MPLKHKALCSTVGTLFIILALAITASAQEAPGQDQKRTNIKNFGQMDERFYRGAQPREDEFKELAALGIRTVIDLRADPVDYEKGIVESLGMKYINIPMVGKKYPTEEAVRAFLKVVNDPDTGSFFVHCAGGRHRTGAMGAVYRYMKYGWTFEQVYAEMKRYDFYTSWGHGAFKDFVRDYYGRIQAAAAPTNTATTSITVDAIPTTDSITIRR